MVVLLSATCITFYKHLYGKGRLNCMVVEVYLKDINYLFRIRF